MSSAIGAITTSAGGIAGGIAGANAGRGDIGEGRNQAVISNQILQEIAAAPDISKPLILEKYKQAGVITPEMESYITASQPKAASVTTDPRFKQAQNEALKQFTDRAASGLTAADRAGLNQARSQAQQDTRSKIAQIEQQAAMRGQAGGGSQLAAELAAAQSGANAESEAADRLAQQSQQAAMQAAAQLGQFGTQMQGQEFNQEYQKANAADEMNRFNVQNQIAQQQRNVGASNQAQYANLGNLQNVNNMNVSAQNQEMNNQLQRQMQQWNANLNRAQIQAGGAANLSKTLTDSGNKAAQNAYNTYSAAAGAAGSGIKEAGNSGGGMQDASDAASIYGFWDGGMAAYNQGGPVSYKNGGIVAGREVVPGDHPANDTILAKLSPKEIVVPKSLAESKLGKELLKLIHAHNAVKHRLNQED